MNDTTPVRVADFIMNYLFDQGVKHMFTVSGRGALFLTDALAKHPEMEGICNHHEQAAAFAAVAYSQYNDNLGACLVSTGCACTNTFTGVLSAWQDGIPVVFISGQNTLKETSRHTGVKVRTYGQQEADIIPMVETMTKYATMIEDPNRIRYELEKATFLAKSGRKGPVWIDVPLDVQSMRVTPSEMEGFEPEKCESNVLTKFDIDSVTELMNHANRPVILIGSGIRSAHAITELKAFVEKFEIPLVYTGSAPDSYGSKERYSMGSLGSMGCSRAGSFVVQNADVLLVIGNRLSTLTTGPDYCKFAREAKIVVVDIDPLEHDKNTVEIDHFVASDAKLFLRSMLEQEIKTTKKTWLEKCFHWKDSFPNCEEKYKESENVDLYYLAERLSEALPEKSVLATDSGFIEVILPTNIKFGPGQRIVHPASQGAMGYALPAAIGAHYASKLPVCAVIGDGSIMMNIQELETIKYNRIPIKLFVVNNNAYAIIRKRQKDLFRKRTIGTDSSNGLSVPAFEQVASCFDLRYEKIERNTDLDVRLREIMDMEGPVLCEIMGVDNQEYIEVTLTRNSSKKLVRRPLEDQAPFISRDLFLSEMLIEPIDQ
ncbi:MAG: acetolactate synthase-1/2/3 large subunit [Luteibaculaceae bacterium]|jgi:acetolactate synthase-1/2/3 large subunit